MIKKINTAWVKLWDETVGAVTWLDDRSISLFEFEPKFIEKNLDISPIHMNLSMARKNKFIFSFPNLNPATFVGLPGLLADCLPDKFGNSIIDAWLARNGRSGADFNPVERLCYLGKRGMGALEFHPETIGKYDQSVPVEIAELVNLTQNIMLHRNSLDSQWGNSDTENSEAIMDILRVGTSAGGARPKAIIAMNNTGNIVSGQTLAPPGYDYWIIKFDGVTDLELGRPQNYGRIEYAYYLMAQAAGIHMMECRLLEEHGRAHFMTKRFDRVNGKKIHLQSLCGIAHFDFNMAGAYSYEQALSIMLSLKLTKAELAEQFRRMIFNVMARNMDDHTKNISFLMQDDGRWQLSPAYDVTYAHNPTGHWTNQHQMSINAKRSHFTKEDFISVAKDFKISKPLIILNEVEEAIRNWPSFAEAAGLSAEITNRIHKAIILLSN